MTHDRKFFAELKCPNPITWSKDIMHMFTAVDVAHMKKKGLDLSSYNDVMINAVQIYSRVATGSMPPPRIRGESVASGVGQQVRLLDPTGLPAIVHLRHCGVTYRRRPGTPIPHLT